MKTDNELLYSEIEPLIDNFHKGFPVFNRDRDVALVHLLRCFEDRARFGTAKALFEHGEVEFFTALQNAQDSLVWATRWIWSDCPRLTARPLQLDWDVYGEAADLFLHSNDYYHLYRCIVLCRRGAFRVSVSSLEKKVRFEFRSEEEKQRDAARQLRETRQDATIAPAIALQSFLETWQPILRELFPSWIEKIDKHSIRYAMPERIAWVFARWTGLQVRQMTFHLPGTWRFGDYSLNEFRSFWKSLLAAALTHSFAHMLGDNVVGTTGLTAGSVVMHFSREELEATCNKFPLPLEVRHAIIRDLSYDPMLEMGYWDPIWQPLFKLDEDSFLVSPSLITGSSAERNLVTLLNKIPRTRQIYHQLSLEKENEQLSELKKLFAADRFTSRSRLNVKRKDGSTLSDADLILFDKQEGFALIVQVKWLIRPDYVTEVAARDQEIIKALKTTGDVVDRVRELGSGWLEQVLEYVPTNAPMRVEGLLVNRDFLPSGWVNDEHVPVVDMAFLENFINSDRFTGLQSLYHATQRFDKTLISHHAAKDTTIVIALGDYTFECPGMEPLDNESGSR